jgi:hypothetical protein
MKESINTNISNESSNFIYNLIEMTRKSDKEFQKFIDYHLYPKKSPLSLEVINKNIKTLKLMDSNQRLIVKARAKEFAESNDPSKYFPSLLVIFGFIFNLYKLVEKIDKKLGLVFNVLVISFFAIFSAHLFFKTVKIRSTAVFFNTLIDTVFDTEVDGDVM